jgi:hypothetical protein
LISPAFSQSILGETSSACSVGWWLGAGADLFSEKSTVGWWLISQTNRALICSYSFQIFYLETVIRFSLCNYE